MLTTILQYEEELIRSSAIAIHYLLTFSVSAPPFSCEHKVCLCLIELPPLEIRFPACHLFAAFKELVLL